ncbi:hypothetical protein [Halobacillus litoralis]|uniref:hypothetical protein n=1 Tax=Halobacillus litoralis TaxID=45668 RepID=UPI001F2569BC|nr:hypothetical protein [Halobacillus litoralis]
MLTRIWFRYLVYALIFLLVSFIAFLKLNPPLEHGSIGSTEDKQSVIVALGNKSMLGSIHITDVSINDDEVPSHVNVQISDTEKGFTLTDTHALLGETHHTQAFTSFSLGPDTSPLAAKTVAAATDPAPATIYGLSIAEDTTISRIKVTYRYFGLIFSKTIHV